MMPTDPQFMYMILVLPSLFGLTLLGEGTSKLLHEEWGGIVMIIFGFLFIGTAVFMYIFFSGYIAQRAV